MTGIKAVARHAGVAVGTVSAVLNRPDLVAPATRQRVLDAIKVLGYVRNDSARRLREGHGRTVAVVVLDVANPFFTDVVRGVEKAVEPSGSMVIICNSGEDPVRELRHLDHLEEQRVRGVLITPVDGGSNARLERLIERGIPVVLVDRGTGRPGRCSVAVDDALGGRLAIRHLIERGHRRIGFVGGPMALPQVFDRCSGASAVVERTPGVELVTFEMPALTTEYGRKAGILVAESPRSHRPTAVFCANDLLALGLLQEMTRRGVRVPADLAIVGYDDIGYAGAAVVPLSSVAQPREDLGRTAAELLFEEINDRDRHQHRQVLFEPEMVVRESS